MPRLNYCADCGTQIAPQATRCKRCWGKSRQGIRRQAPKLCVDCGHELTPGSQARRNPTGRCWNCHVKYLATRAPRRCSVTGCDQPHEAHGLCRNHYKASKPPSYRWGRTVAYRVAYSSPCANCGYNRLPSQVHRADNRLGYQWGNVTPLCSNCHREVTEGLTVCPPTLPMPHYRKP